eukprot:sb/3470360/
MPSDATEEECNFTIHTGNSGTAQVYSDLVKTLQNHLKSSLPAAAPRNVSVLDTLEVTYTRNSWTPVNFNGKSSKPLVILNIGSEQIIHMRSKHNTLVIDVPMPPLSVLCVDPTKEWTNINVVKGQEETSPDHHFWVTLSESVQLDEESPSPDFNKTNPDIFDRSPSPLSVSPKLSPVTSEYPAITVKTPTSATQNNSEVDNTNPVTG